MHMLTTIFMLCLQGMERRYSGHTLNPMSSSRLQKILPLRGTRRQCALAFSDLSRQAGKLPPLLSMQPHLFNHRNGVQRKRPSKMPIYILYSQYDLSPLTAFTAILSTTP